MRITCYSAEQRFEERVLSPHINCHRSTSRVTALPVLSTRRDKAAEEFDESSRYPSVVAPLYAVATSGSSVGMGGGGGVGVTWDDPAFGRSPRGSRNGARRQPSAPKWETLFVHSHVGMGSPSQLFLASIFFPPAKIKWWLRPRRVQKFESNCNTGTSQTN